MVQVSKYLDVARSRYRTFKVSLSLLNTAAIFYFLYGDVNYFLPNVTGSFSLCELELVSSTILVSSGIEEILVSTRICLQVTYKVRCV